MLESKKKSFDINKYLRKLGIKCIQICLAHDPKYIANVADIYIISLT